MFTVIKEYGRLIYLISAQRNEFDSFKKKSEEISNVQTYEKDTKREKKRKIHADESPAGAVEMSGEQNSKIDTFLVIIDNLVAALKNRCDAYQWFSNNFSFLVSLSDMNVSDIKKKSKAYQSIYSADLQECFVEECIDFRTDCISMKEKIPESTIELLKWFRKHYFQLLYPNINIALRICVCNFRFQYFDDCFRPYLLFNLPIRSVPSTKPSGCVINTSPSRCALKMLS